MNLTKDDEVLRDVLDQAADLEPRDREEYVRRACGADSEMRTRLTTLLEALEEAGGFLADPTVEAEPAAHGESGPPGAPGEQRKPAAKIDRYELLEPIGEGGMGTVYRAQQLRPVRREVALKVIKLGMDTARVIGRFEAERQALAMMDHPSIAKVLDAGATETGRPFFVMELVRGVRITDYCDQNMLSLRERLALFIEVCHAVQHAHQKGIIHRDLKPSNVLVTMRDGEPVPKIIDFGIAKATSQQLGDSEATLFTEMSQLVGTPMYMSPEQVGRGGANIDTRVDVYALGVLLYELLTGQTPFERKRLAEASRDELVKVIGEEAPPRLSARVASAGEDGFKAAKLRGLEPRGLESALRGDLDWIVMRCLEKDRSRRYDAANALARDVERHLNDEPVEASPPSALYRLRKFGHRHRTALAAGVGFVGLMIAATAVSAWQAYRVTREKQRGDEQSAIAISELKHAFEIQQTLIDVIINARPTAGSTGREVSVMSLLRNAGEAARTYLKNRPESQIDVDLALADAFERIDDADDAGTALREAYALSCAQNGGERSERSLRIAARLALYSNHDFAQRAYDDALRKFGHDDRSTFRATRGLAHSLGERALSGIYRNDDLHRAHALLYDMLARIDAMPPDKRPPEQYQYMNQLAVFLNTDHQYAKAAEIVGEAFRRGEMDGSLKEGPRASLGFSLVEALRGQNKLEDAVEAARNTYELDLATIGAFDGRTSRMLRTYLRLLGATGRGTEAGKVLKNSYAMARSFYPGDNTTVIEFLTTLARYSMDAGQTDVAIPQLIETALAQRKIPRSEDKYRLLAREALLAQLGCKAQPTDGGIRAQVFMALEDMWRDHPENIPESLRISPANVLYRVSRAAPGGGDGPVVLESTLQSIAPDPPTFEPGLYRLTVEVSGSEVKPFRKSMGILVADWDTVIFGDDQTAPMERPTATSRPAQLISHGTLASIATTYLFRDPPESLSLFIRTRGSTKIDLPSGRYRFTTATVDGIRLFVDGRVAINAWSGHRPRRDVRELELDAGRHELDFDSFQKGWRRLIWVRVEAVIGPHHPVDPPPRTLERALQEQTEMECPEAHASSGTLLAHAGRYPEALDEYGKSLALDSGQPFCWGQSALVYMLSNRPEASRLARARLLAFPINGDRYGSARSAMVVLSDAESKVESGVVDRLKVADVAGAGPSARGECQLAQGMAAYRAGRLGEAAALLGEALSSRLTPEAKTTARVFEAMALDRQGDAGGAKAEFEAAVKAVEAFPTAENVELDPMEVQDRLICLLAVREAEKLLASP
jgi:non-specific serine/threonine protein kinase/serine/threonine-protein kinase